MKRAKRQVLTLVLMLGGLGLITALGAAGFKTQTARVQVEAASYTSAGEKNGYELRDYSPSVIAKVLIRGNEDFAMNEGFGPLAGYIFGRNAKRATPEGAEPESEKIAMTTPVTMEASQPPAEEVSEKIAMTTPVTQEQDSADGNWVAFTMPSKYTLETLPVPKDENVKLEARPGYTAAAIRFTGLGGMDRMREHEELLRACLKRDGLEVAGNPIYARYDPPWTVPIFRRNEVILPVKAPAAAPAPEPAPTSGG
jgi:hypothetical protein